MQAWQNSDASQCSPSSCGPHYLGYKSMVGTQMKQIAFSGNRPLVLAGWRAAALKLEARDCFIGWNPEQRKRFLRQVANNCRFLVLPWVKVPKLASHAPARFAETLQREWLARYGCPLCLWKPTSIPATSPALSTARPIGFW